MIGILVGIILAQSTGVDLPGSAPCAGWKAGPQQVIKPSGIFDYMNGAGELYLAYDLKELKVREYTKSGEPMITCELYKMPSSADAFGVFSQDRTGKQLKIGQGAVYASGLLLAWQGDYFIRILAERETPETKRCVTELAKQVASLCGPPGKLPAALEWLPKKGLDPLSVHYFHTHTVFNFFHFLATDNILKLSGKTNAVMGSYSGPSGKSLLVIIGYPNQTECKAAWDNYRKIYLEGLRTEGSYSLAKLEDGKWTAGKMMGKKLALVLESSDRNECIKLIEATK